MRPGEKLYEELLIDPNVTPCQHPLIFRAPEASLPWSQLQEALIRLKAAVQSQDIERIEALLRQYVAGFHRYNPEDGSKEKSKKYALQATCS